jgi:ribose-phosphate pyrophosphokinase
MLKVQVDYHDDALFDSTDFEPKIITFPGGECHVTLPDELLDNPRARAFTIKTLIKNADHIMHLLMVTDAIRRHYAGYPIFLHMPYIPYARQDRVANHGESLSARVFCDLINAQNYEVVSVADPHSPVVEALLNRIDVVDPIYMVEEVLQSDLFKDGVALVAPDAGARKRVLNMAMEVNVEDVIFADKVRDTKTGKITGTVVNNEVPQGKAILVVDDICDGGRTFLELGKVLKEKTDQPLYLYITHGIFSKGLEELGKYYDRIFTAYNWNDEEANNPQLTLIKEGNLL